MINIKFKVLSFYYSENNTEKNYREYIVNESYDNNMIFEDVLKKIHDKYKINNGLVENYFIPHITELFWKQFFSEKICYRIDDKDEDYYKLKIYELEKYFNISKLEIPVCLNYDGIGRVIGEIEGIKLFFHLNEKDLHHKPHVHCSYSGDETRIEIETLKVLDKPFKKTKIDVAKKYISDNKEELLNYWDRVIINGQPFELKIDL